MTRLPEFPTFESPSIVDGRTLLRSHASVTASIRLLDVTSLWFSGAGPWRKLNASTSSFHGGHIGSQAQSACLMFVIGKRAWHHYGDSQCETGAM